MGSWGDPEKRRRNQSKAETILGCLFQHLEMSLSGQLPPGSAGQGPTLHAGHLGPEGQQER